MDFEDIEFPFKDIFTGPNYSRNSQEICKFSWTITLQEFRSCRQNPSLKEQYLESPEFPEDPDADCKWMMRLYPYEYENTTEMKYSSVYLYMNETSKIDVGVHAKGDIILCTENEQVRTIIDDIFDKGQDGRGNCQLIETSLLESNLRASPATVDVFICVTHDYRTNTFNSEKILLDNYLNLFNSKAFSDLTILTNDNEFKVHSIILAARSKVFATMLTNEGESLPRDIVIDDCSVKTMNDLLNFIYGCKVEFRNIDDALNLLKASDKYELMDLKSQCLEFLSVAATEDNAFSLLLTAEDQNLTELKENLLKFIKRNKRKFTESDFYSEILAKKPRLLVDISVKLADDTEQNIDTST